MEKHSGFFSFTSHGNKEPDVAWRKTGYRQWEVSSREASLIFFNEQKQERFNVMLHASVCRGQCFVLFLFFLTEPSPGRLARVRRVMCTET